MSVISCDVLVVGGGLAGLMAALEAGRQGKSVVVLSKVQPFATHSTLPEAGINLAMSDEARKRQAEDIWNDGHFLSDWEPIELACKLAPEIAIAEFSDILEKDERGEILNRPAAGSQWRVQAAGGKNTGLPFVRRLYGQAAERGVQFLANRNVTSLVVTEGRCVGVTAFNVLSGEMEGYAAGSVILCTGGFGHMYRTTSHGPHMTGDGQALAYLAGVALKDMEFVRFHHAVLFGTYYGITEGAFAEGMYLYNKEGERFLSKYDPVRMEGAETFHIRRYMQLELNAGKGVEDRFFYADFTHLGEEHLQRELPRTRKGCIEALGLDLVYDRLPVAPGCFVTVGGIATDTHGRTSMPGLYAAGECACTGLHGADWRVGNTLLAALVFGSRSGLAACADGAASAGAKPVELAVQTESDRLEAILERIDGEPYHLLRNQLRRTMTEQVGLLRNGDAMKEALTTIRNLQERHNQAVVWDRGLELNQQVAEFIGLGHLLLLAEAVTNAAIARTESRGAQWRSDCPDRDDAQWLRHSLQHHGPDGPTLTYAPVQLGPLQPKEAVLIR